MKHITKPALGRHAYRESSASQRLRILVDALRRWGPASRLHLQGPESALMLALGELGPSGVQASLSQRVDRLVASLTRSQGSASVPRQAVKLPRIVSRQQPRRKLSRRSIRDVKG